ncbi:hypothetical protein CSC36_4046 [Pseudomonas aeruginosa]|nr:hypothetical protein CSC36_4046 [Pseudomonas aeruginosa]
MKRGCSSPGRIAVALNPHIDTVGAAQAGARSVPGARHRRAGRGDAVVENLLVSLPSRDQVWVRSEELDEALDQVLVVRGGAEFGGHGTPR